MTVIVGHKSRDGIFVFSDSALTRSGLPSLPRSAFGEHQEVDGRAVEEMMPKVIELPRHVLAAFSGDVTSALDFLANIATHLKHSSGDIESIVRGRLTCIPSDAHSFLAMFAYYEEKNPRILLTESGGAAISPGEDRNPVIAGSLPEAHRSLVLRIVNTILSNIKAPPEVAIAVVLTALQQMGINEVLPSFGVGGAFFGAYVTRRKVIWQQSMLYCIMNPPNEADEFNLANCVFSCLESRAAVVAAIDPAVVKRMILSPRFPGYSGRSSRVVTGKDIARRSQAVKHFAILSTRDRKAAYLHSDLVTGKGPMLVRSHGDGVMLSMSSRILDYIEQRSEQENLKMIVGYRGHDKTPHEDTMIVPLDTPDGVSIVDAKQA